MLLGRYRIVKLLGRGGFGAVYKAWDVRLNVACAVKENFETSAEAERQFAREAALLANLRHPNLPRVSDHFTVEGQGQYLVMEYIEGEDLQVKLEAAGGPLAEGQVLPWFIQVCDALTYLHTHTPPIIHRDLKPANIRITPEGTAIVVDFGIAKLYDPLKRTTLGARAVTPGYAPFEQYGQEPTDARSDVYALGATLYAVLTGKTPVESIARMGGRALPSPRQVNAAISPQVEAVIVKAMALLPEERFQSVAEFRAKLAGIVAGEGGPPAVETETLPPVEAAAAGRVGQPKIYPTEAVAEALTPESIYLPVPLKGGVA